MARPRTFEPDEAISDVMDVFWSKGFEGASMHDIEAATGLNKQSLYRVFGDKRAMYLAALRRYDETEIREAAALLAGHDAPRQKFERMFQGALDKAIAEGDRRGCFLCNASLDQAQLDPETRRFASRAMAQLQQAFDDALATSPAYRRAPKARAALAAKLLSGYLGLRVLIKANAPATHLQAAADALLADIS